MEVSVGYEGLRLTALQNRLAKESERWAMVVTYSLRQIEDAVEIDAEYYIRDGLEELSGAMDKNGKFTKSELEKAPELLRRVPEGLRKFADEVIQKLSKAELMA